MHNPVLPDQLEPLKDYPIYDEESFLDEASGNTTGISPHPWFLVSNEHYLRSIDGRELVIFENQVVSRYNIWGKDNEGYIDSLGHKFYYLKDHLGSIRVVLGETNNIVSAQDYDVWGYLLDGRSFESNIPRYKFTGKERDKESNYDYFGARYYQFRIGRWNSQDPLFEKHFDFSPYNYVLNNMLKFIDPNGKQDKILTGNKFIDEPIKKELQDLQSTTEGYYEKGTELGEKGFQESEKLAATSYVNFAIKQTVTGWLIITGVSVALPVSVAVGISVAVGAVMYPDDVGVGEDEKLKLEKQREEIELKNFVKDNPQPKKESGIVTPKDKKQFLINFRNYINRILWILL